MLKLDNYLMAGFQILFIETLEIKRCINSIEIDQFINDELTRKVIWNILTGTQENEYKNDAFGILNAIDSMPELSIIILENFDILLDDDPTIQQKLLNLSEEIKSERKMIIIVGSNFDKVPKILEKIITKLEFSLPKEEDFRSLIESMANQPELIAAGITPDYNVAAACSGLSFIEAENALSLSLVESESFNKQSVLNIKRQMIKSTGFLDVIEPEPIENLGGLENLKEYLFKRKEAWEPNSNKPKIKSLFLLGNSGCGKSLASKTLASIMNWPLIIFDIGRCKGSLVGQSEQNIRKATQIIDAISPVVVIVEEIEKIFSGSNQLDSGVTSGLLQHWLTWTQESKTEKIIVANANSINNLPPEFLRAERWDSIWFVDFPNYNEREEIIKIMNRKHGSELPLTSDLIKRLEGWSGAEISQLAKDSLFDELEEAIKYVPLLKNTKSKEMELLADYAKQTRKANKKEEITKEQQRKVTLDQKLGIEENSQLKRKKFLLKKRILND